MTIRYFLLVALVLITGVFVALAVHEEKIAETKLPEPVIAAVRSLYPKAVIKKVTWDQEGAAPYEIVAMQDGKVYELRIGLNGTVVEEGQDVNVEDLPPAIQEMIKGAEVTDASKEVTYWAVTLKKLDEPQVSYTVEFKQDGEEREIEFAEDGTPLIGSIDDDDEGYEDDEDDEEHDDHWD